MTTKPQINKHGQKVWLSLELANGEQAQPAIYLKRLLATQDMEAWKQSPEELKEWIAKNMHNYFQNLTAKIWTSQTLNWIDKETGLPVPTIQTIPTVASGELVNR